MDHVAEKRLLQGTVAVASLVPIAAGIAGVATGGGFLAGVAAPVTIDLDSHFRYLSGLLLGIGIAFATCIPTIERKTSRFRTLALIVVIGGLARLLSLIVAGVPGAGHIFGLAMELGAVPLLLIWQHRIALRYGRTVS